MFQKAFHYGLSSFILELIIKQYLMYKQIYGFWNTWDWMKNFLGNLMYDTNAKQRVHWMLDCLSTQLPISRSNSLRCQIQGHLPAFIYNNQIPQNFSLISKWKFHSSDPFFLPFKFHFDFILSQFKFSFENHIGDDSHRYEYKNYCTHKYKYTVEGGASEIHIGDDGHHSLDNSLTASKQASPAGCWYGITE